MSFTDDFSDGVLDSFWTKLEENGGVVTEQNGRLECNNPDPNNYQTSGVVSTNTVDCTTSTTQVTVTVNQNRMQTLLLCLSKTTGDPWGQSNWYAIQKRNQGSEYRIQRKLNGSLTTIYSATWSGPSGTVKIVIESGVITFYEEGVETYSESYALPDTTCYVYIYTSGGEGVGGLDWFDEFSITSGSQPPPPIISPPLHVEGNLIKDDVDNTVRLFGVSLIHFLDDPSGGMNWGGWSPTVVQANLEAMQTWGINVVRLHTCVEWWVSNYQNYQDNVKDLIQWAGERGMYVIFETWSVSHLYSGWSGKDNLPYPPYNNYPNIITSPQDFIDYWEDVALELKDYPNVLFELYCEPYPPNQDGAIRNEYFDVVESCISAMRSVGVTQLIIIQWGQLLWSDDPSMWTGNMYWVEEQLTRGVLSDANLVFNGHLYRYHGSFNGSSADPSYTNVLQKLQGVQINAVLNTVNKPVMVCETGAYDYGDTSYQDEVTCLYNILTVLNEWGTSYCLFAWGSTAFNVITGDETGPYTPTDSGQLLIDAIAGNLPPPSPPQGNTEQYPIYLPLLSLKINKVYISEEEPTPESGYTILFITDSPVGKIWIEYQIT